MSTAAADDNVRSERHFSGTSVDTHAQEIWSSSDAVNGTRAVASPPFAPRAAQRFVVYSDRLWAIGGASPGVDHNDVWASADGINWNQVNASGLPARIFGAVDLD